MRRFEHLKGSEAALSALEELVRAGRRSVAVYRAAERRIGDHRVRAALVQLRRDHRRHVQELSSILAEIGRPVVAWHGVSTTGPLFDALREAPSTPETIVDALKQAESELRAVYARHVERNFVEPLRAALVRHLREEEAHLAWLDGSRWWQRTVA
jgi:hypothetical protein